MRARILWSAVALWLVGVAGAIGWTMLSATEGPCTETVDGRTYEVECEEGTYRPSEPFP
jgi:hypothetical protein